MDEKRKTTARGNAKRSGNGGNPVRPAVDALLDAMRSRGIRARRCDAIEIAAAIAGHNGSNAHLAAVRKTEAAVEAADGPALIDVWTATIDHRHGTNVYVALCESGLDAQVAASCREWWRDADLEGDPTALDDARTISDYFGADGCQEILSSTVTTVETTLRVVLSSMRPPGETRSGPPAAAATGRPTFRPVERDALIAGLRLLQDALSRREALDPMLLDVLEDSGSGIDPGDGIDALVERLQGL